jgi:hypothetical protein
VIHRRHVTNNENSEDEQKSKVTSSTHCMAEFLKINISSEYSPLIFENISVTLNTKQITQQNLNSPRRKGTSLHRITKEKGNVCTIIILRRVRVAILP